MLVRATVKTDKEPTVPEETPAPEEDEDDEIDRRDIVEYFLKIFKLQIDAPPDAPTKIEQLSDKSSGKNHIYEMRISDRGAWVKRRLTIGPLGEDSGSKSKCFYVIYDVHLVVKIPTRPIDDFDQYIESINKESHIVEKLAPKECVVPKVSVILNMIQNLPDSEHMSPEKLEDHYITYLHKNPDYQDNLKIKNSFIYFMDFSKFYFMGHIIGNLHDLEESIPAEIIENPETFGDAAKFKGRYGKQNESVFFEIREVYTSCEAQIRKYVERSGETSPISLFRIQSWFLMHLAGKEVNPNESGLPPKLIPGLNRLIQKAIDGRTDEVASYRKTIREYVSKIHLEQNKPQMAGIITNLLDLLAWVREKQVSMRDLKPDNLLVAGDPSKYPGFLRSPEEYSLGIIDVETAVDFERSKYKKNQQPLLGGTPFYATPSHFFLNETLNKSFQNFRKILHFQDWHAMVVMIFKVVTDDVLFQQTAKLFGYIKDKIRQSHQDAARQEEVIKEISKPFWDSALNEFKEKMTQKEDSLISVQVSIPDNVKVLFRKILKSDRKSTAEKINDCIDAQVAFQSTKSRDLLRKSSHAKIVQFKKHLKKKFKASPNPSVDPSMVLEFLNHLEHLKQYSEQLKQTAALIGKSEPIMSAYDILTFMFYAVYHTMFNGQWENVCEDDVCVAEPLDDEATTLEAYP
jgi:serine/threonine protein kinase